MQEDKKLELFTSLFQNKFGTAPASIQKLPPSGSYREYYRLVSGEHKAIAAYNEDKKENHAFTWLTEHFHGNNLPVPELYGKKPESNVYLMEDLGDRLLLTFLEENNYKNEISAPIVEMYKRVLEELPRFQVIGSRNLDYSICYPRHAFDRQSMMWDLNYFKYYFLKLAKVPFDEQRLEDDFETFTNFLLSANCNYFLYRDFQSRNVMLKDNAPYFIDYQGGRKGALHYDIASILFEAKTNLPANIREELLGHYLGSLQKHLSISKDEFMHHFYGYVYIRLMQAMGAYGFRGLYEKKTVFLQSIPLVFNHLEWLLNNIKPPVELPELSKVWETLVESDHIRDIAKVQLSLVVNINSFSYKRGIPIDETANGGGFVFDCRAVHNPGRYEQYKTLTGKDKEVIEFLDNEPEMAEFLRDVFALIDRSIEKYTQRGFTNLMVNFGCTGGQHRSVYSAEKLKDHLVRKFAEKNVIVRLRHREQEMR